MFPYGEPIRSPEERNIYSKIDADTEGWRRCTDHPVSGSIIDKFIDPIKRSVSLPVAPFDYEKIGVPPNVLIIMYLESCENAGVYHVSLCGERIGTQLLHFKFTI
jgi:hypothetical protein